MGTTRSTETTNGLRLGRSGRVARVAGVAALAAAAQIAPAATWLPQLRRYFPRLSGAGRADHVALTFDDGPDPESTPAFLDLLGAHGVNATFFLVGERVAAAPELAKRMVAEGHEVAVHGWRHRYTMFSSPGLGRCIATIAQATGVRPWWFRPPYGVLSATSLLEARRHALDPVLWTAWAKDWTADATATSVYARLKPGIVGGATLLLHDAGSAENRKSWTATLGALPDLLRECADKGLQVGTLAEHGVR
jgi:peptidoglycan-N-acetylglucosamine deacetylase